MRKPHQSSTAPGVSDSITRPGRTRRDEADSKLVQLYQDTLEAPIPQDMLSLLERIAQTADKDR